MFVQLSEHQRTLTLVKKKKKTLTLLHQRYVGNVQHSQVLLEQNRSVGRDLQGSCSSPARCKTGAPRCTQKAVPPAAARTMAIKQNHSKSETY